MSNWQDQPATDRQLETIISLLWSQHPRDIDYDEYKVVEGRLREQLRNPDTVYITKGKASEIMGEIRNGYSVEKFRKLFFEG